MHLTSSIPGAFSDGVAVIKVREYVAGRGVMICLVMEAAVTTTKGGKDVSILLGHLGQVSSTTGLSGLVAPVC